MKTTTIGSYPKPSYLKISDWFQDKDNLPEDWEKTWSLLGFLPRKLCLQKLKIITKVAKSFIN